MLRNKTFVSRAWRSSHYGNPRKRKSARRNSQCEAQRGNLLGICLHATRPWTWEVRCGLMRQQINWHRTDLFGVGKSCPRPFTLQAELGSVHCKRAAQDMIIQQLIDAAPCGEQKQTGTPNKFAAGDGVCVRCRETVQPMASP